MKIVNFENLKDNQITVGMIIEEDKYIYRVIDQISKTAFILEVAPESWNNYETER